MSALSSGFKAMLLFFYGLTHNYGVAIIFLTIAIRFILFPLYRYQLKVTQGMKEIQPKQKELQEKLKDKPEEYQKKLMELYKENKVSPMGGCLPLLVQMPIMIALFKVLRAYDFGASPFLWLPGMSQPDPYFILPILSAVTTWYQMQLTTTDQSQRAMTMVMPLFIGWMSFKFPAGLNLYWVISNLISIVQQVLVTRQHRAAKGEAK